MCLQISTTVCAGLVSAICTLMLDRCMLSCFTGSTGVRSFLPCSVVDFMSKQWTCPFCLQRNPFPPHYAEHMTETNLPAELISSFTTVEYQLPGRVASPPAFLFLIDTGLPEEELEKLKESISQALSRVPSNALIGTHTPTSLLSTATVPRGNG